MAHEVESMFYVGKTPWHGLGTKIPKGKELSINEAIVAAGLDWEVARTHIFAEIDKKDFIGIHNFYATYRKKDNAILGIVGKDYKPLQNREAFKWFQPFLDSKEAFLETAGSLKGGRRIWILARVNSSPLDARKNDAINNYILLSSSHDGSLAVHVGFVPIRVVCNNTLCMAHESKASKLLRVRHTAGVVKNLNTIKEIMNVAEREFQATVEQYRKLCKKSINSDDLIKYVKLVFDIKTPEKSKKIVPMVVRSFEEGRGSREAGRTLWGAYNAATEYLNYFRGENQNNTLNSLWFGESVDINKKALNVAIKMAA